MAGITLERDHSVVAIVGEGMAFRPGTGATFTKAMANSGVNIRTIAQGSSERQIVAEFYQRCFDEELPESAVSMSLG